MKERTVFELDGLNILVGANSAGKSSVLQSLLLAAQTLATPMADRPLVLNGPLVRLGLPFDCVHVETGSELTIGFGLVPDRGDVGRPIMSDLTSIDIGARFIVPEKEPTSFRLKSVEIDAHTFEEGDLHLALAARDSTVALATLKKQGADDQTASQYAETVGFGVKGDIPERTVGAFANQFLPDNLVVLRNAYRREVRNVADVFRPRIGVRMRGRARIRKRQGFISEPVTSFIRQFLVDEGVPDVELRKVPEDGPWKLEELSGLSEPVLELLSTLPRTAWLNTHLDDLPFSAEVDLESIGGPLGDGIDFSRRWFAKSVRHLGPLRAAPQPLYGLPEAASGASVGPSGEYTAAVLSAYGKTRSQVPLPDGDVTEVPLGVAVDRWMAKLGLLAAVRSREQGKLGYELQVSVEGVERNLDLTTVGVGVSQALPIIVLGLIAEPHSLLLFEQPELHLHPDVQAELGDFFLALSQAGRQVIIETHSEYLVNRLRRRQAENNSSGAADLTRLFFFERSGSEARVIPARIGPDGSMPNWPRGFLDTAAREAKAIVMGEGS